MATVEEELNRIQTKAQQITKGLAGYVGTRVLSIGIEKGIFEVLSDNSKGITTEQLAQKLGYDEEYMQIWLDAAYGFEHIKMENSRLKPVYSLSEEMKLLLLDDQFPNYIGGLPLLLQEDDLFENFKENLETGERVWWDEVSENWISRVAETSKPFYTRMMQMGFTQIPGLERKLQKEGKLLELACGTGYGLIQIAKSYPNLQLTGLDGDQYSLQKARQTFDNKQIEVNFVQSMFEDMDMEDEFDVIFINNSMHECRDLDKVAANVHRALRKGGIFVISDLPFPESYEDYDQPPHQLMLGINFFESQIDDRLLPTSRYIELLEKHGFDEVDSFELAPVHSVIYGYKG